MTASLPMYWRPETAPHWQAFWRRVQSAGERHGLDLPDLTPPEALPADWTEHWLDPDMTLSMTCGLPLRTVLKGKVTYVGTLDYGLNAKPGHYFSRIIRHQPPHARSAPGGAMTLAYNSADSQSGWAAAQEVMQSPDGAGITGFVETGSHAASLAAVASKEADIAFIDAVTWRLLKQSDPNARKVYLYGCTAQTPALPLITAKGTDPAPLRAAIEDATRTFALKDPFAIGGPLSLTILPEASYHAVPAPPPPPQ